MSSKWKWLGDAGGFFGKLWGGYKLYVILAGVGAAVFFGLRWHWIDLGASKEINKTQAEVIKTVERGRKAHAKIDRQTPFNADKRVAGEWLRAYTRADH